MTFKHICLAIARGGPSGLDRISWKLGTALRVKLPREVAAT
jgi:hypothetical protein